MAAPSINDFRKYLGVMLGSSQWDYNLSQVVAFLTTNYDLTGNNITAEQFFGDISNCTGFPNQTLDIVAGEDISAGEAVRIDTGAAFLCTTSSAGITNFIGIATNTADTGQTVTVARYSYSAYISLVTDDTYYIGTSGAITNTKPSTYAKPIGFALSDTELILMPNSEADTTFASINTTGTAAIKGNLAVNTDKFTVDATTGNTTVAGTLTTTGTVQAGPAVSPFLASPFKVARLNMPVLNIPALSNGALTNIDVSAITTTGQNIISYSIRFISDDGLITVDPLGSMSISANSGIGEFIYPPFYVKSITSGTMALYFAGLSGGVYDSYSSFFSSDTANWDGASVSRGYITFLYT